MEAIRTQLSNAIAKFPQWKLWKALYLDANFPDELKPLATEYNVAASDEYNASPYSKYGKQFPKRLERISIGLELSKFKSTEIQSFCGCCGARFFTLTHLKIADNENWPKHITAAAISLEEHKKFSSRFDDLKGIELDLEDSKFSIVWNDV